MKYNFTQLNSVNSISNTYLNIRIALTLFFTSIMTGTLGFVWIENYNWLDAFYMTVITISTVGYTEVQPLTSSGKVFASILILLNIGIFAYTLSVFSNYVIEGKIFKRMHENLVNRKLQNLENHVIICGRGRYGGEIVEHFAQRNIPFVIIDNSEEIIEEIQNQEALILHIHGDATDDEVLLEAGLKRARALICALSEDADNIFTILTARQLNSSINIISRANQVRSQPKMKLAGANHVIMPQQIGGFYMATLVSKPGAIEFFSHITNDYESDIGFEELMYETIPKEYCNKTIRELNIRAYSGANIIGFKKRDGTYLVNPGPDVKITPDTSFIVLGSRKQLNKLKEHFKIKNGKN